MKKTGTQKISLEKLTIARLHPDTLDKVTGGSSVLTSQYSEEPNGVIIDYCLNEE